MCGIAGMFGNPDRALLERMVLRLEHRGPDDRGVASVGHAALGSTRLSLIDFEGGAQPIRGAALTLVYNGEIYNHATVRRALEREGVGFRGRSDTEVLLRALELHGVGCLDAFEGMYAFAATDGERLTLARDAFGIKPLFYALVDGGRRLIFASELKALLVDPTVPRALDRSALVELATFGHLLGGSTFFSAIQSLPPGGVLEATRRPDGVLEIRVGRHSAPRPVAVPDDENELAALLLERLDASVRGQSVADHPVGAYLSGGVDSTLMTTLMARAIRGPLHTFSIADDPASPDLAMARRVAGALGTTHHEIALSPEALVDSLPHVICSREAPSLPSIVESTAPSVRRHVKAALCGEGADELFAGYIVHVQPETWVRRSLERYNRLVRTREASVEECATTKAALQSMTSAGPGVRDAVYRFFLAGQLTERHMWDRDAMSSSLEVRVPFLDRSLRDLALALPWSQRVRGDVSKVLLREVARRVLPPALADDVVTRSKLAAPSAVRRTTAAVELVAQDVVPPAHEHRGFAGFGDTPSHRWALDLFVLLFVGRGGVGAEDVRPRDLYTVHRQELDAALDVARGTERG